jgi:hypothetical protein
MHGTSFPYQGDTLSIWLTARSAAPLPVESVRTAGFPTELLVDTADRRFDLGRLEFLGMIRRVGVVAAVFAVGCLLVAGLVAIAIRTSVPDTIVVGLVSGVLGSGMTAVATLLAVRWTMEGQRRLDREARESERRVRAVDRRRAAFRQLLVASDRIVDAAGELRARPYPEPQPDFDQFAAVDKHMAEARAAYRAAEPDLTLDLGQKAEPVLQAYQKLRQGLYGLRTLVRSAATPEAMLDAYDQVLGASESLRAITHLELPAPGTEDWPDLPPL